MKKAELPPHCGSCFWHNWEEETAECTHHTVLDDDVLKDALLGDAESTKERGAYAIADWELEDALGNQDYQVYDEVCEHYHPKLFLDGPYSDPTARARLKQRASELHTAMMNEFHARVDKIMRDDIVA